MHPTLFEFQGLGFHTWGLMVLLGFVAACLVVGLRAPKVGIDPDKLVGFYFTLIFAALPASRLFHFLLADREIFFANPLVFFDPGAGGFAFLGGVAGGVTGGALYAKIAGMPIWKLADVAAPTIMLGYAIGRTGCFFAGCCHGGSCDLPAASTLFTMDGGALVSVGGFPWLALVFEQGVGVGNLPGVPLYPTQLWEITIGLVLFGVLSWMWARARRFDGQIMAALLVVYPVVRIVTELFRGDTVRGLYDIAGMQLSSSQLFGAGLIGLAVLIAALRFRAGVAPEVPFVYEEEL